MTLQVRFVLLMALLFAALLGGLWFHDRINTTDTVRLRESLQQERTDLLNRMVELTTEQQRVFTADYSPWDEMMKFVDEADPEWGRINLDAALENHHVDAVWVLRPDLSEVYGTAPAEPLLRPLPLDRDALRQLTATWSFVPAGPSETRGHFHCFAVTAAGLVEIRGAPIRPSDRSVVLASPHGWLISARRWDESYLGQLQDLLGGTVGLDGQHSPAGGPGEIITTRRLPDWQGRPLRTLAASFQAPALVRASADAQTDLLFLCGFGAAALLAFTVAFQFWVVRPLRQLETSLARRDTSPLGGLLRAGGEFGILGRLVDESFQQEDKLRQVYAAFNAIDDAVFITEAPDHRILHVNLGAMRLLGYTNEELVGQPLPTLQVPAAQAPGEGSWLRRRNGTAVEVEAREHLLSAIGGRQQLAVTVARDISDRRREEQQRLRAQRMESLGTLSGGVAHDLNNMLTPVTLLLDELQSIGRLPPPEMLASVRSSVSRSAAVLRQLLAFGRGLEGERRTLSILRLFEEISRIVDSTFPKAIQLQTTVPPNLWSVSGDLTQLHQVLLNLCVNARDAMAGGGVIRMRASNVVLEGDTLEEWAGLAPGPYVQVEVSDTGTGIPPAVLDRIFEPFFTTKDIDKGTGLGLSTTLAIVRSHHGDIRASNGPGPGATFRFVIPAIAHAAEIEPAGTPDTFDGAGRTVLVIEDDPSIRNLLERSLSRLSFRVLVATGGATGLQLFEQHRPGLSLVLTDLQMPGMDGLAVLRQIHQTAPNLPTIVMSGRIDEATRTEIERLDITAVLPKPFDMQQIAQVLREALP